MEDVGIPQAVRRSGRNSGGRNTERAIAAHSQMLQQEMARRLYEQHRRDPEGHSGNRGQMSRAMYAEVPGMPGHRAQQDSEFSVGYHAGSRATCLVCPCFLCMCPWTMMGPFACTCIHAQIHHV